jgi:SOS response regulatory protein OraA/RecX
MTENYLCLGLALALMFLVAALAIRAAILKAAKTPRSELQRVLKRNGITVAILGKADEALLWTEAAGYVDDGNAAAAVSHEEHRIIGRINKLFD